MYVMQKRFRLRSASDFRRLKQDGRVYRHRFWLMSHLPNHLSHNRYGIVTPKYLGNAVTRNRIRRRIREALRHWHLHLECGYDIVIVVRKPVLNQPYEHILMEMSNTLQHVHLS
jgi:ribonuclease P protein component